MLKKEKTSKHTVEIWLFLPNFVGKEIKIHTGKEFQGIVIQDFMVGQQIGRICFDKKTRKTRLNWSSERN